MQFLLGNYLQAFVSFWGARDLEKSNSSFENRTSFSFDVKSYDGVFPVWSPFFLFWVCENWSIAKFTLRVLVFGSQRLELCTNLGGFFFWLRGIPFYCGVKGCSVSLCLSLKQSNFPIPWRRSYTLLKISYDFSSFKGYPFAVVNGEPDETFWVFVIFFFGRGVGGSFLLLRSFFASCIGFFPEFCFSLWFLSWVQGWVHLRHWSISQCLFCLLVSESQVLLLLLLLL